MPETPADLRVSDKYHRSVGCEIWPVPVEEQRLFGFSDGTCIHRIPGRRRLVVRYLLHLCALPAMLLQQRLLGFGHSPLRSVTENIRDVTDLVPRGVTSTPDSLYGGTNSL